MLPILERKEKNCLNCNTTVVGKYCHACGQDNIDNKESFSHLIRNLLEDVTHFDSKYFCTARNLLFKPGFLTEEYLKGRRVKYVHPIKLYIFTSAVFFLLFFSVFKPIVPPIFGTNETHKSEITEEISGILPSVINASKNKGNARKNSVSRISISEATSEPQKSKQDNNWFIKYYNRKASEISMMHSKDQASFEEQLNERVYHSFPRILFVSIAFFSFFLALLFFRRHKEHSFVTHVIFSLHFYCVVFITWLAILITSSFTIMQPLTDVVYLTFLLLLTGYLFKAMHCFYKQSFLKTLIKLFLLTVLMTISLTALFCISCTVILLTLHI